MRYLYAVLLSVGLVTSLFAKEVTPSNANTSEKNFVGKYQANTELAKKMIESFKTNVALRNVKVENVILLQGQERTYSKPFYKIINDYFLSTIKKLHIFSIQYHDVMKRLKVVGTPTSLKITKVGSEKMDEIAQESGADAIFVWDIFNYQGKMQLLAKIIRVNDHEVLWSYQIDEEQITKSEALQKEFKRQYKIPIRSYLIVGANFGYQPHEYKKSSKTDPKLKPEDQKSELIAELNLLYTSTTEGSPKLNFGVGYNYSQFMVSEFNVAYHSFLFDFRYQLNDYIEPIYDVQTGEVYLDRNRQLYMLGLSFGPMLITSPDAAYNKATGFVKLYFNAGFTEHLEYNMGVTWMPKTTIDIKNDGSYDNNYIDVNNLKFYLGVGYKFNVGGK